MAEHSFASRVQRDHIVIDLGNSRYSLSLVNEYGDYHSCFELALIKYIPPMSLLDSSRTVCIPLGDWYGEQYGDTMAIDLKWIDGSQASVIADAIMKATAFIEMEGE